MPIVSIYIHIIVNIYIYSIQLQYLCLPHIYNKWSKKKLHIFIICNLSTQAEKCYVKPVDRYKSEFIFPWVYHDPDEWEPHVLLAYSALELRSIKLFSPVRILCPGLVLGLCFVKFCHGVLLFLDLVISRVRYSSVLGLVFCFHSWA